LYPPGRARKYLPNRRILDKFKYEFGPAVNPPPHCSPAAFGPAITAIRQPIRSNCIFPQSLFLLPVPPALAPGQPRVLARSATAGRPAPGPLSLSRADGQGVISNTFASFSFPFPWELPFPSTDLPPNRTPNRTRTPPLDANCHQVGRRRTPTSLPKKTPPVLLCFLESNQAIPSPPLCIFDRTPALDA